MRIKFAVVSLIIMLANVSLFCQEFSVSARVTRDKISINDRLDYELTIIGKELNNLPAPKLPNFQGKFDVISSSEATSFSWINGNVTSSKIKSYILMPVKVGKFLIEPAEIVFKGEKYQTGEVNIEVISANVSTAVPGAVVQAQQQPQAQPQMGSRGHRRDRLFNKQSIEGNVFVEANTDKQEVYVGEQVVFSLDFYRRIQLWSNISFEAPKFQGIWVDDLETQEAHVKASVNGRWFYKFELLKKALFPLEPGEVTISPARVGFVVNPFDGQRIMASKAISLKVIPLPIEGRPAYFSGAVGSYSLEASVDKTDVVRNSPIALSIVLKGDGNLKSISDLSFQKCEYIFSVSNLGNYYSFNVTDDNIYNLCTDEL